MDCLNELAVQNFRTYLQIDTSHPNPDYSQAVKFLKNEADKLMLEFEIVELCPNNPIVILKWTGIDSQRQSVTLNSHMDVVPTVTEKWKYSPFSAHIDENGNIYARGTQDMKSLGTQYLEAIRRIKTKNPTYIPERTIYILFVPDEELGSVKGMKLFVETEHFEKMNIGVFWDEGITSCNDEYPVFYGQRIAWLLKVKINGEVGHGSQFIENTVGMKLSKILNKFMEFRDSEEIRMKKEGLTLGDVTTINFVGVSGGIQYNVLPDSLELMFDVRITPTMKTDGFKTMLEKWAFDCGGEIQFEIVRQSPLAPFSKINSTNKWWTSAENVFKSMTMKVVPRIFPGGTDSRFIRMKGASAFGFSPINNTPILLHDHNEFININTFIRGIDFFEQLIPALASVEGQ